MLSVRLSLVLAVLMGISSSSVCALQYQPGDVLIRGGRVVDGTGAPAFEGDVLIRGDRIVAIEKTTPKPPPAVEIIDAKGRVVSPGFIDTHSHGDPYATPEMQNFTAMGVTTICLGQDGESSPSAKIGKWFEAVQALKPGVNIVSLVGHGTVREESGIGLCTTATVDQLQQMADLVEQALDAGAFGMSSGLEYQPGSFADARELAIIAKPVGARDLIIMSHVRNEDDDQLTSSIEELIEQCRSAGARAHVAHIKCVYGKGAGRAEEILALLDKARKSGVKVTADIYPYTASHTGLSILFPAWALPPNSYQEVVKNRRGELVQYLHDRVAKRNGPEATLLSSGDLQGKTLAQVAAERQKPYAEVLVDLGPDGGSAAYFVQDEELQSRLLTAPGISICSDGSPTMHHPRGHGAFARVIHKFVQQEHKLTLEQAIHKMTGLSAQTIGLDRCGRGTIKPGNFADILIFDPAKVKDTATFEKPHQLAEGFDTILVNGIVVRKDGAFTGERAGRVLKR